MRTPDARCPRHAPGARSRACQALAIVQLGEFRREL